MKKSILITGVAGLIGSRMSDWIIENHPNFKIGDVIQSKIFFEVVDSLPAINI